MQKFFNDIHMYFDNFVINLHFYNRSKQCLNRKTWREPDRCRTS